MTNTNYRTNKQLTKHETTKVLLEPNIIANDIRFIFWASASQGSAAYGCR